MFDFVEFVREGIIRSIFAKYAKGLINVQDDIIEHTTSSSSIHQIEPTIKGNIFLEFDYYERYMGINTMSVGETIKFIIGLFKTNQLTDICQLPNKTWYEKVIYKWFENKDTRTPVKQIISKSLSFDDEDSPEISVYLTYFVKAYLEHARHLVNKKIISGLDVTMDNPPVIFEKLVKKGLGFYNGSKIVLNTHYYKLKDIDDKLKIYLTKDINYLDILIDPILVEYFSTSIPACTLIHELTHVLLNTSHDKGSTSHGRTTIIVGDDITPEFDEAAVGIYRLAIRDGLFDTFIKKIREHE